MSRRSLMHRLIKSRNGKVGVLILVFSFALFVYLMKRHSMNTQILTALGSRNGTVLVKPHEETTIFQPIKRCQDQGNGKMAVVVVTTLPENRDRRTSIRETWANWSSELGVSIFFFSGRPKVRNLMQHLEDEVYLHGDLILEDLKEDYHTLSVKTLRMLKWFLKQCSEAKFLIKVDDDVFLNIPNIVQHLEKVSKSTDYSKYIGGEVHRGREPHDVNPFSKWYIPSELWPTGEVLPPYTGGPCYILSSQVVPKLYTKSLETPLINLEDVFLTGVIGFQRLGIKARQIPYMYDAHYPRLNFYFRSDEEIHSCTAFHTDGDIGLMYLLYKTIKNS